MTAEQAWTDFRRFVEDVRDATDIEELVGADTELRRSGACAKGLSPFREERTPSFVVWRETGRWKDYSGGGDLGGDVFEYVMERDGLGFKDAVLALAGRAGIRAPNVDPEAHARTIERLDEERSVFRVLTAAVAYYHRALDPARRERWLHRHYGFDDATIDGFQLGWADGDLWRHLTSELAVDPALALMTGLFKQFDDGRVVDLFVRRLIFVYWSRGSVRYLAARKTDETPDKPWEEPKYKKLPRRSPAFPYVSDAVRNDTFFNEDAARGAKELLITEGLPDCVSAQQLGIPCVSPGTTRFRAADLPKLLELTRRVDKVVICNDSEESGAGRDGAMSIAAALAAEGRRVRVATLPRPDGRKKIDLNEFVKEAGGAALREVVANARWYVDELLHGIPAETSPQELKSALAPVLSALAGRDTAEKDHYVGLISAKYGVTKRGVREWLPGPAPRPELDEAGHAPQAALKGGIGDDGTRYYVIVGEGDRLPISSFLIRATERVVFDDGELLIGDVVTERGRVIRGVRFAQAAWLSKRNFVQQFPTLDMQWTGTDDNVQGLLRLLSARDVPVRAGANVVGLFDTEAGARWLGPDGVLGPGGPLAEADLVYVPGRASFPSRLRYPVADEACARALAARVLPLLLELNEPAVLLPVLGWFFATVFRPRVMSALGHFPILLVWGTQGSGKSSMITGVFWPLFGVSQTEPFSATETEFALLTLLSSSNAAPVFIDEYKPSDMPRHRLATLQRYLRRLYGGEVEERGRANQTVSTYTLSAPVCLAGEARPDDPALLDRIVSVSPDKNRLENHPEHTRAFGTLKGLDLGGLAEPYIRFALGRDTASDLAAAVEVADAIISDAVGGETCSIRCRDNLRVVIFGLTMFEAFAQSLGVALPRLDVLPAVSACIADVMDGECGAKSSLDAFVEACSVMAHNGDLAEDKHYAVVDGLTCLHLSSTRALYLEHRRRAGLAEETNGMPALRRQLKESFDRDGYVKALDKQVTLGGRRLRTIALDLTQAADRLDVDPFPATRERSWGGSRSGEGD